MIMPLIPEDMMSNRFRAGRCRSPLANATFHIQMERLDHEPLSSAAEAEVIFASAARVAGRRRQTA